MRDHFFLDRNLNVKFRLEMFSAFMPSIMPKHWASHSCGSKSQNCVWNLPRPFSTPQSIPTHFNNLGTFFVFLGPFYGFQLLEYGPNMRCTVKYLDFGPARAWSARLSAGGCAIGGCKCSQ
jgi:hypothetical protein